MPTTAAAPAAQDRTAVIADFERIRAVSAKLAEPLSEEDQMLQSMLEASPVKWNLAHTTWFFETFLLSEFDEQYTELNPDYGYLFNSYYNLIGDMHPRARRGLLSRPSASDVRGYRDYVNERTQALMETCSKEIWRKVEPIISMGLAHEQQHQELLLTDVKHGMAQNPLKPAIYERPKGTPKPAAVGAVEWMSCDGGVAEVGAKSGFHFDNEGPSHQVFLRPYALASRTVTNREYLEFMEDGGYEQPQLWLSDGWDLVQREGWRAPLYWRERDGDWGRYSLFGMEPINPDAPVTHMSYFEAAAFAEWTSFRLPTEFEWERAALGQKARGNLLAGGAPREPEPVRDGLDPLAQLYGDVWEWTQSPYTAYPGFRAPQGAIGEYNGKFMCNQFVLRGGSCATPEGHIRSTYRNFFPPDARWQFSGFRLARDL